VSITGYFKANETGNWKFMFGKSPSGQVTSNYSNDNLSMFWIDYNDDKRTIKNAQIINKESYKTNNGTNASPNIDGYVYTTKLEAGFRYPIFFNWACVNSTSPVLCFAFAKPSAPNTFITDEIAYREPLTEYIKNNNLKMCFLNQSMCDIVPPCFYHLFRKIV
jgi:hypothetical protein